MSHVYYLYEVIHSRIILCEGCVLILYEKSQLVMAKIVRRYKRFLADMELENGSLVIAHCTNTGTMKSCFEKGDDTLLEISNNPNRKLPYTWIACKRDGNWIGVDTVIPNRVVAAAARLDMLPGLFGLHGIQTEVKYGFEGSRIDILGMDEVNRKVYIEVKNTTLKIGGHACFPDARSDRGKKHLRELQAMVKEGHRAVIIYFIQRDDIKCFDAAREIDPAYGIELERALKIGVEIIPIKVKLNVKNDKGIWNIDWSLAKVVPWIIRSV